jgi:hypothetical protein
VKCWVRLQTGDLPILWNSGGSECNLDPGLWGGSVSASGAPHAQRSTALLFASVPMGGDLWAFMG